MNKLVPIRSRSIYIGDCETVGLTLGLYRNLTTEKPGKLGSLPSLGGGGKATQAALAAVMRVVDVLLNRSIANIPRCGVPITSGPKTGEFAQLRKFLP